MLHFTLTELDQRPPGWDEELSMALAGLAAAQKVVEDRDRRNTGRLQPQLSGKPVYGMPGATFDQARGQFDGRPDLRAEAPREYPELRGS